MNKGCLSHAAKKSETHPTCSNRPVDLALPAKPGVKRILIGSLIVQGATTAPGEFPKIQVSAGAGERARGAFRSDVLGHWVLAAGQSSLWIKLCSSKAQRITNFCRVLRRLDCSFTFSAALSTYRTITNRGRIEHALLRLAARQCWLDSRRCPSDALAHPWSRTQPQPLRPTGSVILHFSFQSQSSPPYPFSCLQFSSIVAHTMITL